VALFTQFLKLEGCFSHLVPKTIWSESHRLKAHYPSELENLRKLREEKRKIYIKINGLMVRVEIPEIFTITECILSKFYER